MSLADFTKSPPYIAYITSKDRVGGTNSNFTSSPIDLGINNYDAVCLSQASIPRSFYNVPTSYNTFSLKEGVSTAIITIPVGSYNRINLQSVLQTQLNTSSPNGWTYVVSYPNTTTQADTFKYSITVSGNTSQPQFIFTTSMFRQLGFDENSTNTFVGSSLTSSNCINLAYATRAFIKSNIVQQVDTLQEILNYGSFPMLSVASYQQNNYDLNTRVFNRDNLNSWTFTLLDEFDQLIDLNGVSWSMTLIFYDRSNTHEIVKTDIQLKNEMRLFEIMNKEIDIKKSMPDTGVSLSGENEGLKLEQLFPVLPYVSSSSITPFIERTLVPPAPKEPLEKKEKVDDNKNAVSNKKNERNRA